MAPKASAASKGKAPERQPTVSPALEEAGPAEHQLSLTETETQTPRHMDDGFSRQQLETVQSMINSSITRTFELNLMPMIQSALEDVLNRRGSVSPTPAPADEQQPSLMPRRQPPLPPFHEPHEPHEYPYTLRERRIEPKLETIGLFDPPLHTHLPDSTGYEGKFPVYHDVFSFVDALRLSGEDICTNGWWKRCLRGPALIWWTTELSDLQRRLLMEASLDTICQALIDRFKMPASSALNQINGTHFAYQQIRNGTHISEHLATCFRLARHADFTSEYHIVLTAWNTLDPQIKLALDTPSIASTKAQLISKANEKWAAIYELATRWKAPAFTAPSTSSKPSPVSNPKPSGPYINRPYAPVPKQIDNKAYMAGIAGDRAYLTGEGKWAYLQYEGEPVESPDQEGEVE
jgi:hypothetical protein